MKQGGAAEDDTLCNNNIYEYDVRCSHFVGEYIKVRRARNKKYENSCGTASP